MKKTIIHISQSAGGVAEYLYMLLKNMDEKKYDNILILSEDYKNQIDRFESLATKIYFVSMQRDISVKKDLSAVLQVRKILKKEKSDIVYMHSSKAGAIGRIALLLDFKRKKVYNAHGWYFNAEIGKKKRKIIAIIERILAIKTDMIINISKNEYESAIKNKIINPKKMCILENGIDFTKFVDLQNARNEIRKKYNIKENETLIGVVGRISDQKDPMTSINAFYLLNKHKPNTKFMFIGSGELEEDVLKYAREKEIEDKIIITGWVNKAERYIPALDVAILPSKWEGFGLALIEYMLCDKPIVASNVGGISNIIQDGENGYLINIKDSQELSEKIEYLIDNPKVANKFIKYNQSYREKYNIKNMINEFDNLIENLYKKEK